MTGGRSTNESLLGVCSTIRGLLAGADRDEVETRHRAGLALRLVRGAPQTYGQHAVEGVADELGLSARTLYQCINVAECWSAEELRAELEKTTRFGMPLSWSHFVHVAAVRDGRLRASLLDRCRDNVWSVRELAQRIKETSLSRAPRAGDGLHDGEAVRAALAEGIETADRAVDDVRLFERALEERLADVGGLIDDDLLDRAEQTYAELQARAEGALARLRAARLSQRRIRLGGNGQAPRARLSAPDEEEPTVDDGPGAETKRARRRQ